MKKTLPFFSGILSILLLSSGSVTPSQSEFTVDPKLYYLYLVNDGAGSDLHKLVNQAKKAEKIVFQFFNDNGTLTLAAYSGKKWNQDFNEKFSPVLKVIYKSPICANCSIDNKQIYLGDQEVGDKDNLKNLTDVVDNPDAKYIIFIPSVDLINPAGPYRVSYKLGYTKDNPAAKGHPFSIKAIIPLNVQTNPSPPHGGS